MSRAESNNTVWAVGRFICIKVKVDHGQEKAQSEIRTPKTEVGKN